MCQRTRCALLIALLAVAAGCGGTPGPAPEGMLAVAAASTEQAGTARIRMTAETVAGGFDATVVLEGVVDFAREAFDVTAEIRGEGWPAFSRDGGGPNEAVIRMIDPSWTGGF